MNATLAVIAKAPAPGRSKTRLCPPLSLQQAAELAEAALLDTLAAMAATPAARRAVILDGAPGPWLPPGFEVVEQRGRGLDERLANGFADLGGPALIMGMDTPQVRSGSLYRALGQLERSASVLGPAMDGGYWAIGLQRPDPLALLGVPMSVAHTLLAQRARLGARGLAIAELDTLRDVDTFADAVDVAHRAPWTRFAAAVRALGAGRLAA